MGSNRSKTWCDENIKKVRDGVNASGNEWLRLVGGCTCEMTELTRTAPGLAKDYCCKFKYEWRQNKRDVSAR